MAEVDRLVSRLVAHLDKVERAASDDALIAAYVSTGGPENMYDVRCRVCRWERYGGRRSELRPMAASHVRRSHSDEAATTSPPERLGLVRATRDLIGQWRETIAPHVNEVPDDPYDAGCQVALAMNQVLRSVARGWGVVDNEEAD